MNDLVERLRAGLATIASSEAQNFDAAMLRSIAARTLRSGDEQNAPRNMRGIDPTTFPVDEAEQ